MRGIPYLLAFAGAAFAQGNVTFSTSPVPLSPSTADAKTEEPVFSTAGGGGHNTCKATTTIYKPKPIYLTVTENIKETQTVTSTCYETVHDTRTLTSTTTCTVVSYSCFSIKSVTAGSLHLCCNGYDELLDCELSVTQSDLRRLQKRYDKRSADDFLRPPQHQASTSQRQRRVPIDCDADHLANFQRR